MTSPASDEMPDHEIMLHMPERVLRELRRAAMLRSLNGGTILDEFVVELVRKISDGEDEWRIGGPR